MSDPYGRFEILIDLTVFDFDFIFGRIEQCQYCFTWQYNINNGSQWIDIDHINNNDISLSITRNILPSNSYGIYQYTIKLIIQSIRRDKSGNCINNQDIINTIFLPNNYYQLRLKFLKINEQYRLSLESDSLTVKTNILPSGGECIIQDLDNLQPLDVYNLFCDYWLNQEYLEFNALWIYYVLFSILAI